MNSFCEMVQPAERWSQLLQMWKQIGQRLQMQQPITLSRCSLIPILFLGLQSLIIMLLEVCGVALGVAGGVTQFVITTLFLVWTIFQLEQADTLSYHHQPLEEEEAPSPSSRETRSVFEQNLDDMEPI